MIILNFLFETNGFRINIPISGRVSEISDSSLSFYFMSKNGNLIDFWVLIFLHFIK